MKYVPVPNQPDLEMEVPDDSTDEFIQAKLRRYLGDTARDQVAAGQARQTAREETFTDYLMAPVRGAMKVPGQAVEMGRGIITMGKHLLTGEFLDNMSKPREVSGPEEQEVLDMLSRGEAVGEFPINPYDPTAKAIARALPSTIGAGVGSLAGPVGAGTGWMAGEALVQAGERSLAAAGGQPVQPGSEMLEDLFATGILGGVTEAAPQVIGKMATAPAKAFQKRITPAGREAMETLPFKARPSLAQVSDVRGLDIAENVVESSLFGGGQMVARKAASGKAGEAIVRAEVGKMPTTGSPILKSLSAEIDVLGEGVWVDTTATQKVAEKLLAKARPLGEFGTEDKFVQVMRKVIGLGKEEELLPGITHGPAGFTAPVSGATPPVTAPRRVDFATMRDVRSQLLELSRAPVGVLAGKADRGAVRHLEKLLKKDMLRAATDAGEPRLVRAFQDFNKTAREAATRGHFEDMIVKATDLPPGEAAVLSGDRLYKALYHARKELRGSLDPESLQRMEKFARVLQTAQSKSTEGTGRIMVQLTQAAAVGGVATGVVKAKPGLVASSAAALGLPWALGKVLTSPRLYRYLTTSLEEVGTTRGNAALSALTKELGKASEEEQAADAAAGEGEVKPYRAPWEVEEP